MEAGTMAFAFARLLGRGAHSGRVRAFVSSDDIARGALLILSANRMTFNAGTHSCMYVLAPFITEYHRADHFVISEDSNFLSSR